ncbi:hypothetical protein ACFYO2_47960 [Streptomyces sp. NPDC006602]|uniref:hypothetical protein n=1 Tax=Streptomyces sp. NPDC006602 TaxID=3364751 RepID=UPI0036C08B92
MYSSNRYVGGRGDRHENLVLSRIQKDAHAAPSGKAEQLGSVGLPQTLAQQSGKEFWDRRTRLLPEANPPADA